MVGRWAGSVGRAGSPLYGYVMMHASKEGQLARLGRWSCNVGKVAVVASSSYIVAKAGLLVGLKAVGFGSAGPAAKSFAAAWMSKVAIANGGGVAAGELLNRRSGCCL
jgi:hypothetical protein